MKQNTSPLKYKSAFTLVELLVVVAVIAILMSLVLGVARSVQGGAEEAQAKAELADLMNEIEKYNADEGGYPGDWNDFRDWYLERYPGTAYTITAGTMESGTNFEPEDPWGQEYVYDLDNPPYVYFIASFGPNTTDDDGGGDDITNRNGSVN